MSIEARQWRVTRLNKMRGVLNERVAQWATRYGSDLEPHLYQAMELGGDLVDSGVDDLIRPTRLSLDQAVKDARDRAEAQLMTVLQERLQQELRSAMLTGKTPEQFLERLSASPAKERSLWYTVEKAAVSRARTQLAVVQAQATQERLEEIERANPGVDLRKKFIAVHSGPSVCPKCTPYDGKIYGLREGPRLPLHPHCRCSYVPKVEDPGRDLAPAEFGPVLLEPDESPEAHAVVERLFQERKVSIAPRALREAEKEHRDCFPGGVHQLKDRVSESLRRFPTPLLDFLAKENGNLMVVGQLDRLVAEYDRRHRLARVSVEGLALSNGILEEELVHMLDHLLGSHGQGLQATLSTGSGVTVGLKEYGAEIQRLFKADARRISLYASRNEREFLAHSIRFYLTDGREVLRNLDPQLYTVVEKWFDASFWTEVLP